MAERGRYGRVYEQFWSSPTVARLSDAGRILALYLISSPHTTLAGVFRLPDGYVSEDLRWPIEKVTQAFAELFANGFSNRCETTKWVWIVNHLKWNPPENPNQRKAAAKIARQIPDECNWKRAFMRVCGSSLGFEVEPEVELEGNPSETVEEPFRNQKQYQEQKQEQEHPPLSPLAPPAGVAEPSEIPGSFDVAPAKADDGSAGKPRPTTGPPDAPPGERAATPYGLMAAELRRRGVKCTGSNPDLVALVDDGFAVTELVEALAVAVMADGAPKPMHVGYLAKVARSERAKASRPARNATPAWWASEAATEAKAREVGCWPARPAETWDQLRARVREHLTNQDREVA